MQLAIYSPADRLQPHRYKADESYEISGPEMTPVQSYLDVEAIVALAKQQSVDAIHPGYGFLSENSTFARYLDLDLPCRCTLPFHMTAPAQTVLKLT